MARAAFVLATAHLLVEDGEQAASQTPPPIPRVVAAVPPPKKKSGCRRIGCIVAALAVAIFVVLPILYYSVFGYLAYRDARDRVSEDGYAHFEEPGRQELTTAERLIMSNREGEAHGNTPEAIAIAERMAGQFREVREQFFTKGKKSTISFTDGTFVTYCSVTPGKCAFLIHVPQLRKFTSEAKESLVEIAWVLANRVVAESAPADPPQELAVGLKGALLYERIMIGKLDAEGEPLSGIELTSESGIEKRVLYRFFAPPEAVEEGVSSLRIPPTRDLVSATGFRSRRILGRGA